MDFLRIIPDIVGAFIRSSSNLYVSTFLSLFCVLFLLPWSIIGVWSPCDEDPNEYTAYHGLKIHILAFILMHVFGKIAGLKVNFEPFMSVIEAPAPNLSKEAGGRFFSGSLGQLYVGAAVPYAVAVLMFYQPFAKFWKRKELLSYNPILFYAPQLGLSVIFNWWLYSSLANSVKNQQVPSIDGMIAFVFKELPPLIVEAFKPSVPMKASQLNPARAVIVETNTKIYLMLLPYCAFLIGVASIPRHAFRIFHWSIRLVLLLGFAALLNFSGMRSIDQWIFIVLTLILSRGNGMFDVGLE